MSGKDKSKDLEGHWDDLAERGNELKMKDKPTFNLRRLIKFEQAAIFLTIWGLFLAFMIDIFHLSAVLTAIFTLPLTHALKYTLYKKVFK